MDVDPRPEEENFFMYEILDDVLETAAYRE
jgi:hypothetical protein